MTDSERIEHAKEAFRRLLDAFLALPPEADNGSFTVHYQNRRVRSVEWRTVQNADTWTSDGR